MTVQLSNHKKSFSIAAKPKGVRKRKPPLSIRFTDEELSQLKEWADGRSLSSVIRTRLFGKNAKKGRKSTLTPTQQQAIGNALRRLGHSNISSFLHTLILAVEEGRQFLSDEEQREMRAAYADCFALRRDLLVALGVSESSASR